MSRHSQLKQSLAAAVVRMDRPIPSIIPEIWPLVVVGAYAKITTFSTSPGTVVPFSAGLPGVGGAASASFNPGTSAQAAIFGGTASTYGTCSAAAAVSAPLCADFGVGGNTTGGTGGLAANSIGALTYNGGSSGTMPQAGAPGGGGAAGPNGAGANGGNGYGSNISPSPGSGGGGANGGTAGSVGTSSTGGNGGEDFLGSGAGVGTTASGGNGTLGGGGAGSGTTGNAGNGGCGGNWDSIHGSGGGGGGATGFITAIPGNGACGGGGGSATVAGSAQAGGNGGYGFVAFKYSYCSENCGGGNGGGSGPTVSSITSSCSGTVSGVGTVCVYSVNFNTAVTVGGSWHPRLNLATSPVPSIAYLCDDVDGVRTKPTYAQHCGGKGSGSGTSTLYFGHTVWGGQAEATVSTSSSAINLNGATIQNSSNVNATLTGANLQSIAGLTYSPGNAYCVDVGGSDSNSGIASTGSPTSSCFATLPKAQTAAQGGSNKTIFLRSTGGNFTTTNNPATCNFTTHNGGGSDGLIPNALICQTASDNGEVWAAWPGDTPVIDGGCPSSSGNVPVPDIAGCVFVAFESGYANSGGSYVTGMTRQGLTLQHFYGGGYYDYNPTNLTETDNTFQDLYNTCGAASNGDDPTCNGAGGGTSVWDWWTNYDVSHNFVQRLAGFGITGASGASGLGGYSMTFSYDLNVVNTICTGNSDCGAIYLGWYDTNNISGLPIGTLNATENMVSNVTNGGCGNGDEALYLDNSTSAAKVAGNIAFGIWTNGITVNDGGQNNLITNNIFDSTACPSQVTDGNQNVYSWYMPGGGAGTGDNITFGPGTVNGVTTGGNITYNASGTAPTPQGLMFGGSGDSTFPTLGLNWYYTATGSFPFSPFGWSNGSSALGLYDSSGVLLSGNPFVNAAAGTAAGYQVINSGAGATIISNGWKQIGQNQGPR
jgi:hypothetical protein